jgi:hypothetical protein
MPDSTSPPGSFDPLDAARARVAAAHVAITHGLRDAADARDALREAARRGRGAAPAADGSLDGLREARRRLDASNAEARAARAHYLETLGAWLDADPSRDVARLEAGYPIALLPVRIETRFGTQDGKPVLRVRVYPDEISADTHEPELTSEEIASGQAYWRAGWDPSREQEAWRALRLTITTAARAAWVVRATTPTNLDHRPTTPPAFPTVAQKPASWTRPAETRVLPDRWIVVCERGDRVLRASGSPIPDLLSLTFSPAIASDDTDSVVDVSGDGLAIDKAVRWTVDFPEAEAVGMGITISIGSDDERLGFDRVFVYGVKASLVPDLAGKRLEALLDAHHFGRGLAFVPQGTPTNNSADDVAGFPPPDANGAVSFAVERGPGLAAPESNGVAFAAAVGVELRTVDHLAGANRPEQLSAAAMNRALWPVTGGYFLEQLLEPLVTPEVAEASRQHFIRWVRGRGPLPAFRVGSTPYGCLPVSSLALWQPGREATPVSIALPRLLGLLAPHWMAQREEVPRSGRGDPDQSLIDVLSMDASAREVWVRSLMGGDAVENLAGYLDLSWNQRRDRQAALGADLRALWNGDARLPRILSAVFGAETGRYRFPLVAPTLSETDPLDFNYLRWLRTAAIGELRDQALPAGVAPQTALLYRLLRHALLREYDKAALDLLIRLGQATQADRREVELVGIVPGTENRKTPWDRLAAPIPGVTARDVTLGDQLRRTMHEAGGTQALAEVHDAIVHLEALPTAELDRLFTETMDTCAHRFDAWVTSLASERLAEIRARRPLGVHLGAFAWVENLRPVPAPTVRELPGGRTAAVQPRNGGFIHAPSMPHAAAAAVLRNAYLTRSGEGQARYALDLSSRRVRRARWLMGAMREGQSLRALLGYQFERGLHERQLETYIEPIRLLFPLPERDELPATGPAQRLSPRDVVDGLRLRAEAATIPYDTDPHLPPEGADRDGVKAEIAELEATFDALSDLLTAEAVYHLVRGTTMGASASFDAQAQGLRPPDPEVVEAPRGGIPLTHRFAIVLGGDPVPDAWAAIAQSPRSTAEPHLDRWLAALLGDPAAIRCRVRSPDPLDATQTIEKEVSLDQLELRPTDLLDLTANLGSDGDATVGAPDGTQVSQGTALDRRAVVAAVGWANVAGRRFQVVYASDPASSASGVRSFPQSLELLRVARELIGRSRALRPGDLLPPEVDPSTALVDERLPEAETRAQLALASLIEDNDRLAAEIAELPEPAAGDPEPDLTALRAAVVAGVAYGAGEFPPLPHPDARTNRLRLVEIAGGMTAELTRRIAAAQNATDARERVQAVFGRGFVFLPRFNPGLAAELQNALDDQPSLLAGAPEGIKRQWMQQASRVRPILGTWRRLEMYARAHGTGFRGFDLAQLPFDAGARWVGLPLVPGKTFEARRTSLALQRAATPPAAEPWVGLMVDEWNETIPSPEETTGIGFNYDDPGAEAAQAVLLAISPRQSAFWDAAALEAILRETFDLAQMRGVHTSLPERSGPGRRPQLAQLIPAIYLAANRRNDTITTDLHGALIQQAQVRPEAD